MKRSNIGALALSLALLLVSVPVHSFTHPSSPPEQSQQSEAETRTISPANRIEFPASRTGVRIDIQNQPLEDVLHEISRQTGIRFKVAPSLVNQVSTANIEAPDWETGIENLLEEISTITLWENSSQMNKVILLGYRNGTEVFSSQPDDFKEPPIHFENNQKILLTKEQLKKLAKGPFSSPLPVELLENPELSGFLHKHGIENPEDMQETRKAMKVRKAARLQLRKLQEKAAN